MVWDPYTVGRRVGTHVSWRLFFVVAQYCFIDLFIFKFSFTFIFQGRGERAYDIYSRLLRERIICVMGPVSVCLKVGTTHFPLTCFQSNAVNPLLRSMTLWQVWLLPSCSFCSRKATTNPSTCTSTVLVNPQWSARMFHSVTFGLKASEQTLEALVTISFLSPLF